MLEFRLALRAAQCFQYITIFQVVRQPFMTDRLVIKHRENTLYLVYLNEFGLSVSAFTLQCTEAKVNTICIWFIVAKGRRFCDCFESNEKFCGTFLLFVRAQSWYDAITKAKHIYSRLKQGSPWDGYNIKYYSNNNSNEMLGVRKSPLNSSIGSRLSSLNNSHRWFDYFFSFA